MRWLDGIINSMDMNLRKFWEIVRTGKPGMLQSMKSQRADTTEQLKNSNHKKKCKFILQCVRLQILLDIQVGAYACKWI